LLNSLCFDYVSILDPHSKEATKLIETSGANYPVHKIEYVMNITESTLYCYPDAGAFDKYTDILAGFHIHGEKVRNQSTGHIDSYKLIGSCRDHNVLIVDDICDGGMTFILLAKELYKAGAKSVSLFVSHGIFSKGLTPLKEAGIKYIFTDKGEVGEVHGNLVYNDFNGLKETK
jgi:ribose-phosphate pyrophosphokinase